MAGGLKRGKNFDVRGRQVVVGLGGMSELQQKTKRKKERSAYGSSWWRE